jgi:hypothetical protein
MANSFRPSHFRMFIWHAFVSCRVPVFSSTGNFRVYCTRGKSYSSFSKVTHLSICYCLCCNFVSSKFNGRSYVIEHLAASASYNHRCPGRTINDVMDLGWNHCYAIQALLLQKRGGVFMILVGKLDIIKHIS